MIVFCRFTVVRVRFVVNLCTFLVKYRHILANCYLYFNSLFYTNGFYCAFSFYTSIFYSEFGARRMDSNRVVSE